MSCRIILILICLRETTTVSQDDPERECSANTLNLAPPVWGGAGAGRRARLSLQSVVSLVLGRLTALDRQNTTVTTSQPGLRQHHTALVYCNHLKLFPF